MLTLLYLVAFTSGPWSLTFAHLAIAELILENAGMAYLAWRH